MKPSAILLALALAAGGGCTIDTQSSIVVDGFYPLVYEISENTCRHGDEENPITSGSYDAGLGQLGTSYYAYVLVRNNLPDNSDESAGRLNSNDFQLRAVDVSIDNSGPWRFLPSTQTVALSAGVQVAGRIFVPVPLISPTLAAAIVQGTPELPSPVANEGDSFPLMIRLRARGVLLDGSEIESNEMLFPITVHNRRGDLGCPAGQTISGCSIVFTNQGAFPVQPDGWTCVTPTN